MGGFTFAPGLGLAIRDYVVRTGRYLNGCGVTKTFELLRRVKRGLRGGG